jgi:hypothetical protein
MRYLLGYPKTRLPDTEDIPYSSKRSVSDPVTSIQRLIIHNTVDGETVY